MIKISDEVKEFCKNLLEISTEEKEIDYDDLERAYLEYYSIDNEIL
ncbi:hypothetical protein [Clostridium sartagoforme]|nr:hypothetical protein [Clostridium sartagoforme]